MLRFQRNGRNPESIRMFFSPRITSLDEVATVAHSNQKKHEQRKPILVSVKKSQNYCLRAKP